MIKCEQIGEKRNRSLNICTHMLKKGFFKNGPEGHTPNQKEWTLGGRRLDEGLGIERDFTFHSHLLVLPSV